MRDNSSIKSLPSARRSRNWRSRMQRTPSGGPFARNNSIQLIELIVLGAGLLFASPVCIAQQQQQTRRFTLPNDPEKAWAEVEKVHEALRRPDDWATRKPSNEEQARFQKQVRQSAQSFADKA